MIKKPACLKLIRREFGRPHPPSLPLSRNKAEGRRQEAGGRRQEAGGRRQGAGGRRQKGRGFDLFISSVAGGSAASGAAPEKRERGNEKLGFLLPSRIRRGAGGEVKIPIHRIHVNQEDGESISVGFRRWGSLPQVFEAMLY
ncbi:hypothetical protein A6S26_10075 [Nostoc sp. ATCC 43529]|nr:hypothetical protein A6S26_10075 [Nostoc sp. ATCC 43529]